MKLRQVGNDLHITDTNLNLGQTFDCGQCFRWLPDSEFADTFHGIAYGRQLTISKKNDEIIFFNTDTDIFNSLWKKYFDFDTDYDFIKKLLSKDSTMKKACKYADGIHILQQEPWETVCTFIISQNNNIPRIRGIVTRLCESFGNKISDNCYSFPSAETVSKLTADDLSVLRAGFRTKYIMDAATKIADGEINIDGLYTKPLDEARKELRTICGIGPKVADCILLFAFHRIDAFPIDVWIARALDYYYKDGFPEFAKPYGGIAQQYIFHYIRTCKQAIPDEYKKK